MHSDLPSPVRNWWKVLRISEKSVRSGYGPWKVMSLLPMMLRRISTTRIPERSCVSNASGLEDVGGDWHCENGQP